jgi:hypothetical protein
MLQENQIKQSGLRKVTIYNAQSFSWYQPTVGAGSPKGPLIPFMLLVFYLSSHDTILVTIQKSDVSTFQ